MPFRSAALLTVCVVACALSAPAALANPEPSPVIEPVAAQAVPAGDGRVASPTPR
jgi:hypothetical protein